MQHRAHFFSAKMVRAFHILCLNWMQVELRDGVILSGACNRVIPVETVYIHSVVPSSVALAVWEDVDLFHALQSFEPFVVTAFFNRPNSGSQSLNLEWSEHFSGYKRGVAI